VTSPAPPEPERPTRRPGRRLIVLAGLAGAALAALIAAVVWRTVIQDRSPGPLVNDTSESIGIGRHPREVWTHGNAIAWNTGEKPVVLTRIWLVNPTPGLRVLATRVAGPNRKLLFVASDPKWPADDLTDLHPVAGFQVAPRSQPAGDRGVEFVFSLRSDKPGRYVSRAIGVDYTVDDDKHRLYLSYGLGVCVTAASKPLDRNCQPPATLRPDEIKE
jgi:hypothetical protein